MGRRVISLAACSQLVMCLSVHFLFYLFRRWWSRQNFYCPFLSIQCSCGAVCPFSLSCSSWLAGLTFCIPNGSRLLFALGIKLVYNDIFCYALSPLGVCLIIGHHSPILCCTEMLQHGENVKTIL